MTRLSHYVRTLLLAVALCGALASFGLLAAACSDDDDDDDVDVISSPDPDPDPDPDPEADPDPEPTNDAGPPEADIDVTLDEWSVTPAETSTTARVIRFIAQNDGEDTHEFVIRKDGEEEELAEIEDIAPDEIKSLTFRLEPGRYELSCLLVEEDENEDHYANGMHAVFEVK